MSNVEAMVSVGESTMISRTAAASLGFHRENRMSVAILGGGLQGCCAALALATRGIRVTLYERNSTLLAGAATANEGKIHLGYHVGRSATGCHR